MSLTWLTQTTPNTAGAVNQWQDVTWSPSLALFCAVGKTDVGASLQRVMTSPDGQTWTLRSATEANTWSGIAWSPTLSLFAAVASTGTNRVMTSPDGITWTARSAASATTWNKVVWSPGLALFVACANSAAANSIMTSADGITWTGRVLTGQFWKGIAWSPSLSLLTVVGNDDGSSHGAATSSDGITWTQRTTYDDGTHPHWRGVAWSADLSLFAAVNDSGTQQVMTSSNGTTWTGRDAAAAQTWQCIGWSHEASAFVAGSFETPSNMSSTDGITWTAGTFHLGGSQTNWTGIASSPSLATACAVCATPGADLPNTAAAIAGATSISPSSGSVAGGYTVTLTGTGVNGGFTPNGAFNNTLWIGIGSFASLGLGFNTYVAPSSLLPLGDVMIQGTVVSSTSLTFTMPTGAAGAQDIVVITNTSNPATKNLLFYTSNAFTYNGPTLASISPSTGAPLGGTTVTLTGTNFFPVGNFGTVTDTSGTHHDHVVTFDGAPGVLASYVNATTLTCTSPANTGVTGAQTVTLYPGTQDANASTPKALYNTYTSSSVATAWTWNTVWWTTLGGVPSLPDPNHIRAGPAGTVIGAAPYDTGGFYLGAGIGLPPSYTVPATFPFIFYAYSSFPPTPPVFNPSGDLANFTLPGFNFGGEFPGFTFNGIFFPIYTRFPWVLAGASPPTTTGWWLSLNEYAGAALVVSGGSPADPRTFDEVGAFAASSAAWYGGFPGPAGVWNNHLLYAKGGYTVGTTLPTINIFDGAFGRLLATLPTTSGGVTPKAVMTLLVANGTCYLATLDSGADSTDWSGRVFSLDPSTGNLSQLGATFPAGHAPYALAFHEGRLWCGTHRQSSAASGRVYFIRPGIDTAWTQDRDLATDSLGGVSSLLSFQGLLYVGTSAPAATFAKVLVRGVDTTYSTSLTATGGTARAGNGFPALATFGSSLYASYWNPDTTAVSKIYAYDGSSWTTPFTASTTATRVPYIALPQDQGSTILALGGGIGYAGALLRSTNGTSWVDDTSFLTQGAGTSTGVPAFGVVVA